jgi:Sugar transferases involved in lipopolysaccharide synthesis
MGKLIKRMFDFAFALLAIAPGFLLLLLGMIVVKIVSPEVSPIFKQVRVGYKGIHFTLYKLRSMTDGRDECGNLLPDKLRLKKWGKIIRATNMDELFQIWNILTGTMSWIGPRPLLPNEMLVMSEEEQRERQSMRPGITGWEAVHEEMSETRSEMAQFDLYYIKNWSLLLDCQIFFKTIVIISFKLRPDDSVRAPKILQSEIKTNKEFVEYNGNR